MLKIFEWIIKLLDRFFIALGAFAGSQIPQFMHQYQERLAGHLAALDQQLQELNRLAFVSSKTLEQYIEKFKNSPDFDFSRQGIFIEGILTRFNELQKIYRHLTESALWLRPYYFFTELQLDIAYSTLSSFVSGFQLTFESFCYTLGGAVIGGIVFHLILSLIKKIYFKILLFSAQSIKEIE